jgi:DNA-binding CsgD family transcriptional regulator
MRLLGKLFVDAHDLYVFGHERIARSLYSDAIGVTVRQRSAETLEICSRIREPFRPSLPFFRATVGLYRAYPELIGQGRARVDSELSEREGLFQIHLPPTRSLASRARRLFWDPAHLAGVSPETLSAAIEIGLDEGSPTAPAQLVGQRLASHTSSAALDEDFRAVMAEYFCCKSARLWMCGEDGELKPLSDAPVGDCSSGPRVQRALVFAGQEVGRLEADLCASDESPLFEALLPWVAMAVESCHRLSAVQAPQDPAARAVADRARIDEQARAWSLTPRETEVLELLVRGLANKEIATALDTSVKTCEAHVSSLLHKSGADSRAAVIARFWAGKQSSP